MLIHSFKMVI